MLKLESIASQFIFEALWRVAYCTFIFIIVYRVEGRDFSSLSITFKALPMQILIGVAIGLALIAPIIYNVFIAKSMSPRITGLNGELTLIKILPYILNELILVGFTEELIFRGFLFNRISEVSNVWVGLIVSSVLFGLVHYPLSGDIYQTCLAMGIGCLFVLLMMAFPSRVSIISLAVAHGLYDSGITILVYTCYMLHK